MKILSINYPHISADHDVMINKSPFGYDVIICSPTSLSQITGSNDISVASRWRAWLEKWLKTGKLLLIIANPSHQSNYLWLPTSLPSRNFQPSGQNNSYIGSVVTKDIQLREYFSQNKFRVISYFSLSGVEGDLEKISQIDEDTLTAFSFNNYGETEVIYLPFPDDPSALYRFIAARLSSSTEWMVEEASKIKQAAEDVQGKIDELENKKAEVVLKLDGVNRKTKSIIENDVYLTRAIDIFDKIRKSENPDPEDYYEGFENIEKAFNSEYTMRDLLKIEKSYYDDVMQRTNTFRHAQAKGEEPELLSDDEKSNFSKKLETVIKKYLEYLFDKA